VKTTLPEYVRFDRWQRLEHALFLLAFTACAVTGLAQKFATSSPGEWILALLGGIEMARRIHRIGAIVMMIEAIYHVVAVLYRVMVRRSPLTMIPAFQDFKHLYQDFLFYLGLRKRKAFYGRYSYAEKVEYGAVVWGTLIMAITGFMMWNPIAAARWFSGEIIPAAKTAHGGEAILAVLAIVLWHFYHVHIRHFNKSMFTGSLTRREMEHEHPAELAMLDTDGPPPPSPQVLRRRTRVFAPLAAVLAASMGLGVYAFISVEETALATVPPAESAPAFLPQTPTPLPVLAPAPTPAPLQVLTWEGGIAQLLSDRCGACHVSASLGELSLANLASALRGGITGPAVVPGEPDVSLLVIRQGEGGHPGQLSPGELEQIRNWIEAGAPQK
jgi:cytochrome b subunit of formate dehydrogenase